MRLRLFAEELQQPTTWKRQICWEEANGWAEIGERMNPTLTHHHIQQAATVCTARRRSQQHHTQNALLLVRLLLWTIAFSDDMNHTTKQQEFIAEDDDRHSCCIQEHDDHYQIRRIFFRNTRYCDERRPPQPSCGFFIHKWTHSSNGCRCWLAGSPSSSLLCGLLFWARD